ncbi:MAG TPA: dihydrodipicolinate synthase family protein [Candidatus Competibacteraceae bacterium]|nr:dihydrodipicolinate synthase family protein [Candidatus Competibacteraceae bacterium]
MSTIDWSGVFPAVTTKFKPDQSLDLAATARGIRAQLEAGVDGIIAIGSLGENQVLEREEKLEVVRCALETCAGRAPLVVTVAERSTAAACRFAEEVARLGAQGLMVLPGMGYVADRRETLAHYRSVAQATELPIMVYNNPVSYRVDITPEMFAELADEPRFQAIKESSDDIRRQTDIRNLTGERYRIFCGVDDLALESLLLGADGWVAGLVCAFPHETVALYRLARAGRVQEAVRLYHWFMPLLHLDVSTKLVQNIKLAEVLAGLADNDCVRAPRLPLAGEERARVEAIVRKALATRPTLPAL